MLEQRRVIWKGVLASSRPAAPDRNVKPGFVALCQLRKGLRTSPTLHLPCQQVSGTVPGDARHEFLSSTSSAPESSAEQLLLSDPQLVPDVGAALGVRCNACIASTFLCSKCCWPLTIVLADSPPCQPASTDRWPSASGKETELLRTDHSAA